MDLNNFDLFSLKILAILLSANSKLNEVFDWLIDYREVIVFKKAVFNTFQFFPRENKKPVFSNSSSMKSVFEKLHFRDGLMWTAGVTVEI